MCLQCMLGCSCVFWIPPYSNTEGRIFSVCVCMFAFSCLCLQYSLWQSFGTTSSAPGSVCCCLPSDVMLVCFCCRSLRWRSLVAVFTGDWTGCRTLSAPSTSESGKRPCMRQPPCCLVRTLEIKFSVNTEIRISISFDVQLTNTWRRVQT